MLQGPTNIVALLFQKGADPEILSLYRGSALVAACRSGHIEIVRSLLDSGANVNLLTSRYGTFGGSVAITGTVDVVRFLLESGADVNLPGGKFGSPLACACHGGTAPTFACCLIAVPL
ncbi:ankyrin repeat-containing domain protein [Mycena rosella]|uniref:Ankyrin repeat-containing domain protein n=1 Tax=Mycena rosella TaxID=1033263 RepID=A0AAD7CRV5_MYCRO|nr:ankyrin repeat-containing domain protein [Mycena rosella]